MALRKTCLILPHHQVFIDEKPDYYGFEHDTQQLTGAEVFAMFAPLS